MKWRSNSSYSIATAAILVVSVTTLAHIAPPFWIMINVVLGSTDPAASDERYALGSARKDQARNYDTFCPNDCIDLWGPALRLHS